MSRYFVRIQYKGTNYSGWQYQPNASTVQEIIEHKLSKILRGKIGIMGCGRTDAGVHASDYYFHFDFNDRLPDQLVFKLNMMLPKDIAVIELFETVAAAHSRFDAVKRSYEYRIHKDKSPFNIGLSYYYPHLFKFDTNRLNEMSRIFLDYEDFFPFCKTNTDVKTTICKLSQSEWEINDDNLTYHVSSDRFLRGMVRLLVGCCINYVQKKIELEEVRLALEKRQRLKKDLSVPAEGLFLNSIIYPSTIRRVESHS